MITGTSTISPGQYFYTALAWRYTPPGGPIRCGANPTAPTSDHAVTTATIVSSSFALTGKEGDTRVGTSTNCSSAHGDVLGRDLGHFDDLLGIRHERVKETEDVWQLFHRLRHRTIEDLHHKQAADKVDKMLHGVPLDPLLWPRRLCQAGRPPPAGLFVVQAEEHRLERRSLPDLCRAAQPALLLPGPGLPLSSLVRSGATLWPGPQRSTAANVATMSAVVAACDAEQLQSRAAR